MMVHLLAHLTLLAVLPVTDDGPQTAPEFAAESIAGATLGAVNGLEDAQAPALDVQPASLRAKTKRRRGPQVARIAARWVGVPSLHRISRHVTDDCSGLVTLAYRRAGVPLFDEDDRAIDGSAVKGLYVKAKRAGALRWRSPRPGDLVFFRNTYDRNGDGRRNDGLTHVGVVEKVERDGTVVFIHRGGKGVVRSRMNLSQKATHTDAQGRVRNDYLRRPDGTPAPRLAGQLFAGYATGEKFAR